jgi:hypothetical protein
MHPFGVLSILAAGLGTAPAMKGRTRQIETAVIAFARQWWWAIVGPLGIAAVVGVGVVLSFDLARQTRDLMDSIGALSNDEITSKDRADLVRNALQYQADNLTKLWTGDVQAIGAVVLAMGGYFTWLNLRVTQQTLKATQDKLEVDREAQITNRFTQAIGQLGAETKDGTPNLEVRLGGIFALERIAKDSPRDSWTIAEVLTAYVRQNARWVRSSSSPDHAASSSETVGESSEVEETAPLRTDIQGILTVLGRRVQGKDRLDPERLDLQGTNLRRARLNNANMDRANLAYAHLERAFLIGAHLEEGVLIEAHLQQAYLMGAYLKAANLVDANLYGADLRGADLEGADLGNAHLEGAYLDGADLRFAKYLTAEEIESAASRKATRLPAHLAYLEELDETLTQSTPPPPSASGAS